MARKPLTAAQKAAVGKRLAEGRAAKKNANGGVDPKGPARAPAPEPPAFMQDGPAPVPDARQGEVKPSAEAAAAALLTAENELAAMYAGVHFIPAWALQIPELQVQPEEAREVAKRFIRMMNAYGFSVEDVVTGKIGATLNFALVFVTIELMKLALVRNVLGQRQAAAREQAQAAAAAAGVSDDDHGPAPGMIVPDVTMGGFSQAAE